ncbi:MAG: toxin-antitoxin system YwqK family antitoxin [Aureispira sp.]
MFFLSSIALPLLITGCSLPENSSKRATPSIPVEQQPISTVIKETNDRSKKTAPPLTDTTQLNQYKDGKKEGLWREFDKEGRLSLEGYYKNGKAEGWMKWYYEGNFAASGLMKGGKREGPWKICDVHDPNQCIDATFEAGQETGVWQLYHDNGVLWKRQQKKNRTVLSEECWDEQGQPISCP